MRELIVAAVPGLMFWGASVIGMIRARRNGLRPNPRSVAWSILMLGAIGFGPGVVLVAKALVADRPDLAGAAAMLAAIWIAPYAAAAVFVLRRRWPTDARPR